ncbi:MAG: carbohydrate ABC transporter permease [Deinococcota bacterium]
MLSGLRWLVFVIAALAMNFPVLVTLITSLKTRAELSINPSLWVREPTFTNYQQLVNMADRFNLLAFLFNSTVASLIGALLPLIVALPAAYAMVRLGLGQRILLPGVVNIRALPLIIFALPIYMMYQQLNLLDTRIGLGLILALVNLPLTLVLLVNAVGDVPVMLEEAARIDGARSVDILRYLIIPLSRSALATTFIFGFITAWNEYLFGLILTTRSAMPMTVGASFFFATSGGGVQWGVAAAVMMVGTLVPSVLGLLMYRRIGASLTAGALKG